MAFIDEECAAFDLSFKKSIYRLQNIETSDDNAGIFHGHHCWASGDLSPCLLLATGAIHDVSSTSTCHIVQIIFNEYPVRYLRRRGNPRYDGRQDDPPTSSTTTGKETERHECIMSPINTDTYFYMCVETQNTEEEIPDVSKLDIRVGTILSAEDHPEADSLYVESIDLGEEEGPRTIVSGLKKYISLEELTGRKVLVLANLKARNMRGIKSHGMLLCASNSDHTEVEPLSAPDSVPNGERVFFGDDQEQGDPALPNQLQKKKFWEKCQPLLKTNASGVAIFQNESSPMMTTDGPVKAARLFNATIS